MLRTVVDTLQVSGNPFVRSAAIATLTRWLTENNSFQERILNSTHTIKLNDKITLTRKVTDARKPVPKDVPGVVSDYFQDILEAEAESLDTKLEPASAEGKPGENPLVANEGAINTSTTTLHIEQHVLSAMYQATNSADVETSYKTLDFWFCLFWLHAPHTTSDFKVGQLRTKSMKHLQELYDAGRLTQELVMSEVPKLSAYGVESLKKCVDNTGSLRLMLGMLDESSKMAAVKVCFLLQVLQGMFLASGSPDDVALMYEKPNASGKSSLGEDSSVRKSEGVTLTGEQRNGNIRHLPEKHHHQGNESEDAQISTKHDSDLHQVLDNLPSDLPFEKVFTRFLQLDLIAIGQIIRNREIDTLDSVLDDLIEPDEGWGLPGDANVDCY